MFIKTSEFKKLINAAYKSCGLTVGNDGEGIFVAGAFWVIWVKEDKLPNKEKAAIIELTGDLPGAGEVFKAVTKEANQYELSDNECWRIREAAEKAGVNFHVTKINIEQGFTNCRVMQVEGSNRIALINNIFNILIDGEYMVSGEESTPIGPVGVLETSKVVYWQNEVCTLAAYLRSDPEDKYEIELLQHLEKMVLH